MARYTLCLTLCTLGSTGFAGAQDAAENEPRVLRTMSIRDIVGHEAIVDLPPFGTWTGDPNASVDSMLAEENGNRLLATDFVSGFVLDATRIEAREADVDLQLDAIGARLMISGGETHVARAERVLRTLRAQVAHPLRVEYQLFTMPDGELREVRLAPGDLARVAQSWSPVWSAVRLTRSGFVAVAAQERYTRFVRDADVEVAEKSAIADPMVSTVFEGVHVRVEPHALPDSTDCVVFGQLKLGELHEPMQTRSSGVDEMGVFDVPTVRAGAVTFSGRIENGGTLLVHVGGASEAGLCYVLAVTVGQPAREARPGAAPAEQLQVLAIPISALTTDSLSSGMTAGPASDLPGREAFWPPRRTTAENMSRLETEQIERYASDAVFASYEAGTCVVRAGGGFVLVAATPTECARIRSTLQSLHDQFLRNSSVEVTTVGVPVSIIEGSIFPMTQSAGAEPVVVHRLQGPALLGRSHVYLRGIESTVTQDFEVEIAAKASASNPVVVSTFAGVLANLSIEAEGEQRFGTVDVHLATIALGERRPIENRTGGDLHLPRSGRSQVLHNGTLPSDGVLQFGDVGVMDLARQSWQMRQRVRVSVP